MSEHSEDNRMPSQREGAHPSGNGASFQRNGDNRNTTSNNDVGAGISPFLLMPTMDHQNPSPANQFNATTQMDYRIAQAWISSAPAAGGGGEALPNAEHPSHHLGGRDAAKGDEPEGFQDEFSESLGDQVKHTGRAIFNSFEGVRQSLFSYTSAGEQQQMQQQQQDVNRNERNASEQGWHHDYNEQVVHDIVDLDASMPSMPSTPSTPPSIPEDLMDLSSNKNNSHVDNDDGKEISSDEDENDVPSPDVNGNSSFKAVATPGEIQEESPFGWTRTPQSHIPDEIILDDDQRGNMEDENLTLMGEQRNHQPERDESGKRMLFRPPTLGASSKPKPVRHEDRQITPQSWHTPISMLPMRSVAYRNTSGGSRRTRGSSAPLSPGSRRSAKSEKYFHSYETNTAANPKPVPPFVVVHKQGSAVVRVVPKKTILLPSGSNHSSTKPKTKKSRRKQKKTDAAIDTFVPVENTNGKSNSGGEANCGCDGTVNSSTKVWCRMWGRPVAIALTVSVFILATITVVTSLVANRFDKNRQQQLRPPQNPPPALVLDANRDNLTGNLDVPWDGVVKRPYEESETPDGIVKQPFEDTENPDGIVKRPYEESENPDASRPTLPLRTFAPSVSPYNIPTSAPTLLPANFPDYVPTNLPFLQEPAEEQVGSGDANTAFQIPWNNYVIGLLSVESPDTFCAFDDATSPQFMALQWISVDTSRKGGSTAYDMDASLQRFALATLYFALGGADDWLDNDSWLSTVVSVCDWKGITCDPSNTAVLSLSLPENNLTGELPEELKLLKYLQTLSLPGNSIKGSLPSDYSILYDLVEMNLSNNLLTGSFPEEYGGSGSFELLETLDVCSNYMTGTIPSYLESLSSLQTLKLGNNGFTGDCDRCVAC